MVLGPGEVDLRNPNTHRASTLERMNERIYRY
jgi:hypothetical protein